MIKQLDFPQLLSDILALAAEHPDRKASCLYFDDLMADHPPQCIVGHAIARQGVTYEDMGNENGTAFDILVLQDEFGEIPDVTIPHTVQLIQAAQDTGVTWSEAVSRVFKEES